MADRNKSPINALMAGGLGLSGVSTAAYLAASHRRFAPRRIALGRFGAGTMVLGTTLGIASMLRNESTHTPLGYTSLALSAGSTAAFLGGHLRGALGRNMNRLGWAGAIAGGAVAAYNYLARGAGTVQHASFPTAGPGMGRSARDRARAEQATRQSVARGYATVRGHYARGANGSLVWVRPHMRRIG